MKGALFFTTFKSSAMAPESELEFRTEHSGSSGGEDSEHRAHVYVCGLDAENGFCCVPQLERKLVDLKHP